MGGRKYPPPLPSSPPHARKDWWCVPVQCRSARSPKRAARWVARTATATRPSPTYELALEDSVQRDAHVLRHADGGLARLQVARSHLHATATATAATQACGSRKVRGSGRVHACMDGWVVVWRPWMQRSGRATLHPSLCWEQSSARQVQVRKIPRGRQRDARSAVK